MSARVSTTFGADRADKLVLSKPVNQKVEGGRNAYSEEDFTKVQEKTSKRRVSFIELKSTPISTCEQNSSSKLLAKVRNR